MNINEQLKLILKFNEGEEFFSFINTDGKRWLMPARNMRTAMNLYQPSGSKGRLLKNGLPWLYRNPVVLRILHADRLLLALSDEMRILLERIFGKRNLEFSIFCGTPGVHQKITLQVCSGSSIIGYVKVTASEDIRDVFEHEKHILTTLHANNICNIPQCLYCGTLGCGLHIYIQTTIKTAHSKVVHGWTNMHSHFLEMLAIRTRQKLLFEQTDFCRDLDSLKCRLDQMDESSIFEKNIAEIKSHYAGNEVTFSAFQADFTPWNMFEENGNLFVFDWEYARLTYPPHLDYYHFKIQTAFFEKHLNVDEIYKGFQAERDKLNGLYGNYEFSLKCYLLSVIFLYINRERGAISNDTRNRLTFWLKLLKKLDNFK